MGVYKYRYNKKEDRYLYRFYVEGKRHQKKQFKRKKDAEAAEREKRKELEEEKQRKLKGEIPIICFHELCTQYLDSVSVRNTRGNYVEKVRKLREFIKHVGADTNVNEITRGTVTKFLDMIAVQDQEDETKKVNRYLKELRACFNFGIDQQIVPGMLFNPCKGIALYPEDQYVPYIPPPEDIAAVYLKASVDEREFMDVIRCTLARKIEVVRLTWNDVNFEKRTIIFYTKKRRSKILKKMVKPINSALMDILERRYKKRRKDDPRVFYFALKELRFLEKYCDELKIRVFGFHALRHRAASILNDSGKASMKEIQLMLGHDRQTTTETYLHHLSPTLHLVGEILVEADMDNNFGLQSGLHSEKNTAQTGSK